MSEYFSIAEFAQRAGVSKQAIYKQVNSEDSQLAPYVKQNGKRKTIAAEALIECYGKKAIQPESMEKAEQDQLDSISTEQSVQPKRAKKSTTRKSRSVKNKFDEQTVTAEYLACLKAQIATLQSEKQELNRTIQEKDQIIKQQSDKLAELAEEVAGIAHKALVTTSQQQYLTAQASIKTPKTPPEKKSVQKTSRPGQTSSNGYHVVVETKQDREKKSLFQKLFGPTYR